MSTALTMTKQVLCARVYEGEGKTKRDRAIVGEDARRDCDTVKKVGEDENSTYIHADPEPTCALIRIPNPTTPYQLGDGTHYTHHPMSIVSTTTEALPLPRRMLELVSPRD